MISNQVHYQEIISALFHISSFSSFYHVVTSFSVRRPTYSYGGSYQGFKIPLTVESPSADTRVCLTPRATTHLDGEQEISTTFCNSGVSSNQSTYFKTT